MTHLGSMERSGGPAQGSFELERGVLRPVGRGSPAEESRRPRAPDAMRFALKFLGRELAIFGLTLPSPAHPSVGVAMSSCLTRADGIGRSFRDPAPGRRNESTASQKTQIQCLPEVSCNHVWRTGTSVDNVGGDHNLKVLVLPVRGSPLGELLQVVGVGDKFARG